MFLNFNYFVTSYSQKQQTNVQLKFGNKQQHGKMNTGIYCEYKRAFFFFFKLISQSFADREYVTWQTENDQFTGEACDALLKLLKKQQLDPILDQLHGKEGAKVFRRFLICAFLFFS